MFNLLPNIQIYAHVRRDFLVLNLQATFRSGFLLKLASGLLWQKIRSEN